MSRAKQDVNFDAGTTRQRALKEARNLLQLNGFNGFSFQHVADHLGIKKASLYSHFESKEDLGRELVADYEKQFAHWIGTLKSAPPEVKIASYFSLFQLFANDDFKICPVLAMSVDMDGLPAKIKKDVAAMSTRQLDWLEAVIAQGRREKTFQTKMSNREAGLMIMTMGLGAQLTARLLRKNSVIQDACENALRLLETT